MWTTRTTPTVLPHAKLAWWANFHNCCLKWKKHSMEVIFWADALNETNGLAGAVFSPTHPLNRHPNNQHGSLLNVIIKKNAGNGRFNPLLIILGPSSHKAKLPHKGDFYQQKKLYLCFRWTFIFQIFKFVQFQRWFMLIMLITHFLHLAIRRRKKRENLLFHGSRWCQYFAHGLDSMMVDLSSCDRRIRSLLLLLPGRRHYEQDRWRPTENFGLRYRNSTHWNNPPLNMLFHIKKKIYKKFWFFERLGVDEGFHFSFGEIWESWSEIGPGWGRFWKTHQKVWKTYQKVFLILWNWPIQMHLCPTRLVCICPSQSLHIYCMVSNFYVKLLVIHKGIHGMRFLDT